MTKTKSNIDFFCCYCKTRKKINKYIKTNNIKNKIIIDIKEILEKEDLSYDDDKSFLKIVLFQKIQSAIEKKKDIYYIPNFDVGFDIDKIFNLKKILSTNDSFNVLIFYNEFVDEPSHIEGVMMNIDKFDNSQILKDY
jgi:hypothetical protein